jgi:phage shock protein A
MADREDFALRLLRLEQQVATLRQAHEEELARVEQALEVLKERFLTAKPPVADAVSVEGPLSSSTQGPRG